MATYGKPTTSFYINYGTLDPGAAERALAPALIAPRYRLHRLGAGYGNTLLGAYGDISEEAKTEFGWPELKQDEEAGIVDKTSAKLLATETYVNIATGLTCSWESVNCLKFTNPVQGENRDTALNGYDLKPGDIIQPTGVLTSASGYTVVDILPSETEATVEVDFAGIALVTGSKFTAENDAWYLCTVTTGTDVATIKVSTIFGDTFDKTFEIKEADTAIDLGSYGIKLAVTKASLTADEFIVKATAAKRDTYNLVYIDGEIPEEVKGNITVTIATANLTPSVSTVSGTYWDFSDDGIKVHDGACIKIGSQNYEIAKAVLHMQYRELLTDDLLDLKTSQTSDIATWAGPADPENPMGMMYAAASTAAGTFFYLLAVGDTEAETIEGINYIGQFESAYAPIAYLQTPATQSALVALIAKYSDPQIAQFKHTWLCSITGSEDIVYEYNVDSNGVSTPLLGKISGETLTLNEGDLLKHKIKKGDYVVLVGAMDTDTGKFEETEYRIDQVTGTTTCELVAGAKAHGLSRIYFKRKLSGSAYAEKLAAEASAINNIRVNFVASDELSFMGFEKVNPVYLCAALASTRCALPPHAPMNELPVTGFTVGNKYKWTDTDYETMNAGGVWVVAKDVDGNTVNYHQVTTRTDGTIAEEDSVVSNGDAIVRQLRQAVKPYASGKSNVTGALLDSLRDALNGAVLLIQNEMYPPTYGNRILNFDIQSLYIPEGNKRSIVCACRLDLPQPMQDGQFTFNLF